MDKYIPIIVILVSIVFSIIGKKKKPAQVTQETTLPGKTVREYVEEKKVSNPAPVSYQKIPEEKSQKRVFQRQEIKPGKEFEAFSSTSVMIEPEEEDSPFHFEEDDVVQAIIYAEIINRKEY